MSSILKPVVVNPTSYFHQGEIELLRKFIAENSYTSIKLQTDLDRVNLEIAKIMGRA